MWTGMKRVLISHLHWKLNYFVDASDVDIKFSRSLNYFTELQSNAKDSYRKGALLQGRMDQY
ncbi:hypothetical protein E2C01_057729 [Portunus trituberculatus]|uniref:Uncharacterized protein n=1 Tax=Portunus trituberculatus TaxID=210409 RepID=A0A5B7H160_PORTR|nr:hypothetical protein [Portunus trituberculatus]